MQVQSLTSRDLPREPEKSVIKASALKKKKK
jgi:hypothetical protein